MNSEAMINSYDIGASFVKRICWEFWRSAGCIVGMELTREFIQEGLRVRRLLDLIRFHEDFARTCEQQRFAVMHDAYVQRYRELIGVTPDRREALREILEPLQQGSAVPLASIIDHVNVQTSNGSGLASKR